MTFPRIPSENQLYLDSDGALWEYTFAYGWTVKSKAAPKRSPVEHKRKPKVRPRYGSTRIRTTDPG